MGVKPGVMMAYLAASGSMNPCLGSKKTLLSQITTFIGGFYLSRDSWPECHTGFTFQISVVRTALRHNNQVTGKVALTDFMNRPIRSVNDMQINIYSNLLTYSDLD